MDDDFAEVRRALSAKNLSAARRTPLIGAFPKIFIPAVTIIPGLVALAVIPGLGGDEASKEFNNAIPLLMNKYLPNGMLGVALAGLLAAFMAGVAANVGARAWPKIPSSSSTSRRRSRRTAPPAPPTCSTCGA